MASILNRFKNVSVGSSGRIVDYTAKINASGDFTKIYDIDAILNSWNNILTTPRGSMDHDPMFGSNLYRYIFEPADDESREGIKIEILDSLAIYDSRAIVDSLDITYYPNKKGFQVSIMVDYDGYKSKIKFSIDEDTLKNFT